MLKSNYFGHLIEHNSLYENEYVIICVYIYAYIHTIYIYTCICVYIHVYVYIYMYVCIYIYDTCMCACIYIYMERYRQRRIHTHTKTCLGSAREKETTVNYSDPHSTVLRRLSCRHRQCLQIACRHGLSHPLQF